MLSFILRHGAAKEGYKIDSAGYVLVSEIINHRANKHLYITEELIRDIVKDSDK
jgi:RNA:NAD 2'-phosphotransferase (TPT1/KptA family)